MASFTLQALWTGREAGLLCQDTLITVGSKVRNPKGQLNLWQLWRQAGVVCELRSLLQHRTILTISRPFLPGILSVQSSVEPGVGKLWPMSQFWPTTYFCKYSFIGTHPCNSSVVDFAL